MSTEPEPGTAGADPDAAMYEGSPEPSRRLELGFAVVAVVLMAVLLLLSITIPLRQEAAVGQIDARFWPTLLSAFGIGLGVWRLIIVLTAGPEERDDLERIQRGGVTRLLVTLGLTVLYIAAWNIHSVILFGYRINLFVVVTTVFLAALMWLYGARRWKPLILYPVLTSVGIFYLFGTLLRIPL